MSIPQGLAGLALVHVFAMSAQTVSSYNSVNAWWQAGQGTLVPTFQDWENATGQLRILNQNGDMQTQGHAFFTALGTNGRACVTCHQLANGMSVGPALLQPQWAASQGNDPVFAAVDGSNCPSLPQSQMSSHSLLLNRGLFRIQLPWPPNGADGQPITPDFQIDVVSDPTGCNTSPVYGLNSQQPSISVYRRPRVVANVQYLSGPNGMYLAADGRESSLQSQATDAALSHEGATSPLSADQLQQIVDFENQVFSAQNWDAQGGMLNELGGPPVLSVANLALGLGGTWAPNSFDSWRYQTGLPARQQAFRQSAVRGFDILLNRQFNLGGGVTGTCVTCHQPGTAGWMDIGTTNLPTAKNSPELPLFKITCNPGAPPHPVLGTIIYTQDPGRALITGKCADTGSIVTQQFHGLAARPPYFSTDRPRRWATWWTSITTAFRLV